MIIGADPEAERVVELLVAEGYVLVPSTQEKVVSDLARYKPKLLIFGLDERSTRVDELIQRIQATAYGAIVPVVFFGPPPGPNPAEVVVLGGDLFLPSPVEPQELVASIRRLGGAPPAPRPATPRPPDAASPTPESSSKKPEVADGAQPRKPTISMAKTGEGLDSGRPAKVPEPLGPDSLEDLSRSAKIAMPWDDDGPTRGVKSGDLHPPADEPDLLKRAIAADLMLDPREMALTITTMVPEMGSSEEDLPPAEDVTAAPSAPADPPPPTTAHDDHSAVDAIVQEFMGPGGDGDTVAVRIRRTINAFEEQIVSSQPDVSDQGPTPPPFPPEPRPSGGLPRAPSDTDEIDLDALDVDNAAAEYEADPERVLQKLEDGLGAAAPQRTPSPGPAITSGGTEVSLPGRLPPEPEPRDDPAGAADAAVRGKNASDPSSPFTPAPKDAYTEAREVPAPEEPSAHGTIADPGAPLASPYDLPPVVSAQGFEYVDPRGERRDVVDTVPGRRTAVHFHLSDDQGHPLVPHVERSSAAVDTQPAKGLGGALDRDPEPTGDGKAATDHPPQRHSSAPHLPAAPRTPPEVPVRLREGTLDDLDPASLIQAISFHKLDGALELTTPDARYDLFFADGVPRLAQSSRPEDRMVEMLRRQGRVTARQLRECELEVAGGRRAGAVLLDRGWIGPAELIPTVRLHLEDLVYAIFAAEEGTFRFDADQPLPDEIVYLEQRTAALVLEGIRRKYTPGRIIRLAGGEKIIPIKAPDADEGILAGAELSGHDWRIIDALDGRSSVTAVAERLDAQPHDVWALAWGLACLGLVKLQHRPTAPVADSRRTEKVLAAPMSEPSQDHDFDLDVERVVSRHAIVREGDYFACLGVAAEATPHELRRAYDQARSQFDPRALHPAVRAEYEAELREILDVIEEAYSVLRDDAIRESYHQYVVRSASAVEAP